jgi:hypothetical protein
MKNLLEKMDAIMEGNPIISFRVMPEFISVQSSKPDAIFYCNDGAKLLSL